MNPAVLSCSEHYRKLGKKSLSFEITGAVSCHGDFFAEGKTPCCLCLGFISGLAPQGLFLSGAPLPVLQGENMQQPGREPRIGSAQRNTNRVRRWGVSGTNPISYHSQTSCSMLQKPSVQQLCETDYPVKIPRWSLR